MPIKFKRMIYNTTLKQSLLTFWLYSLWPRQSDYPVLPDNFASRCPAYTGADIQDKYKHWGCLLLLSQWYYIQLLIDTIEGAKSSAIIYSIAETAKANNLKPYDYFEYLLTEILERLDGTSRDYCEDLFVAT